MPEAFASVDRCPYLAARTGEIAMITSFLLILFSVNFLWPFYRFIIGILFFSVHTNSSDSILDFERMLRRWRQSNLLCFETGRHAGVVGWVVREHVLCSFDSLVMDT